MEEWREEMSIKGSDDRELVTEKIGREILLEEVEVEGRERWERWYSKLFYYMLKWQIAVLLENKGITVIIIIIVVVVVPINVFVIVVVQWTCISFWLYHKWIFLFKKKHLSFMAIKLK